MLAAGSGTRLRPLTSARPKALCAVNNVALLDRALGHLDGVIPRIAVNAHYRAEMVAAHLAGRPVHLSIEEGEARGTAGAVGLLADWLGGRDVLIFNADAFHDRDPVSAVVEGWDGERPRLLVVRDEARGDFGSWRFAGVSVLPGPTAARLTSEPSGLHEVVWRQAWAEGELELVEFSGTFVDCGTPADYLRANLHASGGATVIGEGAVVEGEAVRCVVWPGARVEADECLLECIRAPGPLTVDARLSP